MKAEESGRVQRARKKLERTLEVEHKKFTTDALHSMGQKIRQMIVRQHPQATFLKKRKFSLFDENAHTAKTKSKRILKLEHYLKMGSPHR